MRNKAFLLNIFLTLSSCLELHAMKNNTLTLQAYENGIDAFAAKTISEIKGVLKTWIDTTLCLLPPNPRIIEIGSATGKDAYYIEAQGFAVERTDAVQGFVTRLVREGYSARLFNVLTDDFGAKYDLIFANTVFLHFTPEELNYVFNKAYTALTPNGILAFSVKIGEGQEWSTQTMEDPRYFCYWQEDTIRPVLAAAGFQVVQLYVTEDGRFLDIIAQRIDLDKRKSNAIK